jgi:single-strand DNA-binding protein
LAGDFNMVQLICRLTADPETRSFTGGGSVTKFRVAFTGTVRKVGNEWQEEPCFMDVEAFNREQGRKPGKVVQDYCGKGSRLFVRGHLQMDTWDDKDTGQKRQKIKVVADDVVLLDKKGEGPARQRDAHQDAQSAQGNGHDAQGAGQPDAAGDDIPF